MNIFKKLKHVVSFVEQVQDNCTYFNTLRINSYTSFQTVNKVLNDANFWTKLKFL